MESDRPIGTVVAEGPTPPSAEDRPPSAPPADPGWFATFLQVLTAPARAFAPLRENPRLKRPLLVISLATLLLSVLLVRIPFLDIPSPMIGDLTETLDRQGMPEEHQEKVFELMSGWLGYVTAVAITVGEVIVVLGIGLALALVLGMVPSPAGERSPGVRRLLSVSAHAAFIDVVEMLLKAPLYVAKGSFRVYTSPAVLLSDDWADTRLFRFLDSFDLFTIWKLAVLGIGVSVVAGRPPRQAALLILIPWALSVALRVALHGVFSGGEGVPAG